ncbi:hypothetical protein FRB97_001954 [Tulasnella sp. 331]|nr:hypothetical protein FRB97_001954 [Tulasnella sp. 331]
MDLQSGMATLSTVRSRITGANSANLVQAIDKLLKLSAVAKAKAPNTNASRSFAVALNRLDQDLLGPITANNTEIRLAPTVQQRIDVFANRISGAVDRTVYINSKFFFSFRSTLEKDLRNVAEQLSKALDELGLALQNESDYISGVSDINVEITSPKNDRLILHDSQGFEQGELANLHTVKDFIRRRNAMPALQDRIHAVWLCIQIPYAGGRLLETGDEEFLKADFGLPVIVVFTKYDILRFKVNKEIKRTSEFETWRDDEAAGHVEAAVYDAYERTCIEPLKRVISGRTIPAASVSVYDSKSLENLVKLTSEHAQERLGGGRDNIGFAKLNRKSARKRPDALYEDDFKKEIRCIIFDLTDDSTTEPNKALSYGAGAVSTVSGIVGGLSGPAAPIVIPIAAGVALGYYLMTVYNRTPPVLRVLMGYIIDLTIILEGLFNLLQSETPTKDGPKPSRLTQVMIKETIENYTAFRASEDGWKCHAEIRDFVGKTPNIFSPEYRTNVSQELVRLMQAHRFRVVQEWMDRMKENAPQPVVRNAQ